MSRDDLQTGLHAHRQGRLDEAARIYQGVLQREPDNPDALYLLGVVALRTGQPAQAADLLGRAVALRPGQGMIHADLGQALRALGKKREALDHLREAARLLPGQAETHSNLGLLLLETGAPAEALPHLLQAVRIRPDFAPALLNLGNALRDLNRMSDARGCYAQALSLDPQLALACHNLGQVLLEEGRLDEALAWFAQALCREPTSRRFLVGYAGGLAELERFDEAVERLEEALRHAPGFVEAWVRLGRLRIEQARHDDAIACFREALRLWPDCPAAHDSLGLALEEMGRFDEAAASYRQALRVQPRLSTARARLATMLRAALPAGEQAQMEQMLAEPTLHDTGCAALHHGLANVLDARGHYPEAAEHLRRANAHRLASLRQRQQHYDPAAHQRWVDDLLAAYSPAFFERTAGFGLDSERPVFVLGLPRSGTTLTEQVLASHSQVFGAGEHGLARRAFDTLAGALGSLAAPFHCLPRLERPAVQALAEQLLRRLAERNASAARVVDKLPDNYLHVGLIPVLFPRARIIHCRRDLRDVALSCWMTNFSRIHWTCHVDHISSRFEQYRRVMEHWRQVLPMPMLEVDYEEMVADLEGTARRLVAWCGLEWQPACLDFHKTRRPISTASATQVRRPLYSTSVGRWKNYEHLLGDLFARL
jgi:tetratricopeptide (TPR) repeat protein